MDRTHGNLTTALAAAGVGIAQLVSVSVHLVRASM